MYFIGNRGNIGVGAFYIFFAAAVATNNLVANEERVAYPQVIGHAGASGYLPESTLEVLLDFLFPIFYV